MMFVWIVAGAFALAGACLALYNLTMALKSLTAEKKPATIIGIEGSGRNSGIRSFVYRVKVAPDHAERLERRELPFRHLLNPFYSVDRYVGRTVSVPYDSGKNKLLPQVSLSLIYVLLGSLMGGLGGGIMFLLLNL